MILRLPLESFLYPQLLSTLVTFPSLSSKDTHPIHIATVSSINVLEVSKRTSLQYLRPNPVSFGYFGFCPTKYDKVPSLSFRNVLGPPLNVGLNNIGPRSKP